jgi:tRNA dimethylallyltransferase
MPAADPAVRAAIDRQAQAEGWPALHAELAQVDPATATRLAPMDSQRIQRALEVYRVSGRPLSAWHGEQERDAEGALAWPMVSLEPVSRAWLHGRIAERLDAMLAAGLLDEVRTLRSRGDLRAEMPAMRCVGYRQCWQALDSGDFAGLRDTAIAATRQLAKRQLTWLRSISERTVAACDKPDGQAAALQQLTLLSERVALNLL